MADDQSVFPDQGLGMAAGIAQGAANFVTAYRGAQQQQVQNQRAQQEMEMKKQMYALQMAKLQKEIQPVQIDAMKVGLAAQLAINGKADESLYNSYLKKSIDNIETPAQAAYAAQLAQQPGYSMTSQGLQKDLSAAYNQGSFNPSSMSMNPAEQKLMGQSINAQTMLSGKTMGIQSQREIELAKENARISGDLNKYQMENEALNKKLGTQSDLKLRELQQAAEQKELDRLHDYKLQAMKNAKPSAQKEEKIDPVTLDIARKHVNTLLDNGTSSFFVSDDQRKAAREGLLSAIQQYPSLSKKIPDLNKVLGLSPSGSVGVNPSATLKAPPAPATAPQNYGPPAPGGGLMDSLNPMNSAKGGNFGTPQAKQVPLSAVMANPKLATPGTLIMVPPGAHPKLPNGGILRATDDKGGVEILKAN